MVDSPCIQLCTLNDRDICLGCYRTLSEITAWSEASAEHRRAIRQQAAIRKRADGICQARPETPSDA